MFFKMFSLLSRGLSKMSLILITLTLIGTTASNQILLGSRDSNKLVNNCTVPSYTGTLYSLQATCSGAVNCNLKAGQKVLGSGTMVGLKCLDTYMMRNKQLDFVLCYNGAWYPNDHSCLKTCSARHYKTIDLSCSYNGNPVSCDTNIRFGTIMSWSCKPGYETAAKPLPNQCLKNGIWQYTLTECVPERRPVSTKIKLGNQQNSTDFEVGKQVSLSCHVDGYPAVTSITWFKDGLTIIPGDRIAINETKLESSTISYISIQNATLPDSGTYQCRAENEHSYSTNSVDIFAFYFQPNVPDNLLSFPMHHKATLNNCGVNVLESNKPPHSVKWFKSGQQILTNEKINITSFNCTLTPIEELDFERGVRSTCISQLIIEKAGLNDSDEYKCEIDGEYNITMQLSVYVPQEISTVIKMEKTTFPSGSEIEIPCEVNGFPMPNVVNFFVNGYKVDNYQNNFESSVILHKLVQKRKVLSIYGATIFHSGSYKCRAERGSSVAESSV